MNLSVQNSPSFSKHAVELRLATIDDDAAIRAFLRIHAMDGPIRLAVATEPSFFAAVRLLGQRANVLIAVDAAAGRIGGLGVRTVRRAWIGGKQEVISYLSMLRIGEPFRRRREFLRNGYAFLGDLERDDPTALCLTAILKENTAARRLLEANLRGLPRYRPVAEIHTFTLGTSDRRLARCVPKPSQFTAGPLDEAAAVFLQDQFAASEGAPVWNAQSLDAPAAGSLCRDDFVAVRRAGQLLVVGALWDQRPARQLIVTGYGSPLRYARLFYNGWCGISGRARLPHSGMPLSLAYLSHLAVDQREAGAFRLLLQALAAKAARRQIDYLVVSLPAPHPLCATLAPLASHKTESILYSVRWVDSSDVKHSGLPYVEAGQL